MAPTDPDDYYLRKLLSKIQADRGFDYANLRRAYLARRVETRLLATGASTVREYIRLLDSDPGEYPQLIDALTVNVSEFFRDKTTYRYLADHVVPEIVAGKLKKHYQSLRVWSAGCSTGQEPYSVAMLFREEMAKHAIPLQLSVMATDIDRDVLARAKAARYPATAMEQIPAHLRQRYVLQARPGDEFEMAPEIKYAVKFRMLDLFADNPIGAVDLIMCRNVMIYFDRSKQARVYAKFETALRKGGFLVVGRSEKVPMDVLGQLITINPHERIYQRLYSGGG